MHIPRRFELKVSFHSEFLAPSTELFLLADFSKSCVREISFIDVLCFSFSTAYTQTTQWAQWRGLAKSSPLAYVPFYCQPKIRNFGSEPAIHSVENKITYTHDDRAGTSRKIKFVQDIWALEVWVADWRRWGMQVSHSWHKPSISSAFPSDHLQTKMQDPPWQISRRNCNAISRSIGIVSLWINS